MKTKASASEIRSFQLRFCSETRFWKDIISSDELSDDPFHQLYRLNNQPNQGTGTVVLVSSYWRGIVPSSREVCGRDPAVGKSVDPVGK